MPDRGRPSPPAPPRAVLQWYQNFRSMGYEHTVMLTELRNSSDCDTMARLEPGIGCAWDSTELPGPDVFAGARGG